MMNNYIKVGIALALSLEVLIIFLAFQRKDELCERRLLSTPAFQRFSFLHVTIIFSNFIIYSEVKEEESGEEAQEIANLLFRRLEVVSAELKRQVLLRKGDMSPLNQKHTVIL